MLAIFILDSDIFWIELLRVTGVCAQTLHFTDKDTILSHMGRYKGLKIFMVFDSVSFVGNNTALKSSLKPLNMHVKIL